jgi:hypothetical protein
MKKIIGFFILSVSFLTQAQEVKFGSYRILNKRSCFSMVDSENKVLIKRISTQFYIPEKNNSFNWKNFSFNQPRVIQDENSIIFKGQGNFQKDLPVENSSATKMNISVEYSIEFSKKGKIFINYSYMNKGEDVYFKPYALICFPYNILATKKWILYDDKKNLKHGIWPSEVKNGLLSVSSLGGGRFKESHITAAELELTEKEPIKIILPGDMQLRLHGNCTFLVFNYNYSSLKHKSASAYKTYNSGWTVLKKGKVVSIKAELNIPFPVKVIK